MEPDLQEVVPLLTRTPATLQTLLRDLPSGWILRNEGDNTWNALEIVAHLVHTDRTNWMPRVRTLLEFGESQPFPPFNRLGQREASRTLSISELLDEFAQIRRENLDELSGFQLQPTDFERRGYHPVLGVVTLSQVLAAWTTHDLTHLHQLIRLLAHPYRQAVGPFAKLLGVLQCAGHSAPA